MRRWRARPWRGSGLYKRQLAPAEVLAADRLRAELVDDHLHGEPTAGQQVVLSLLASAAARHANVSRYLASLGDVPYCDRRSNDHATWKIVHDLSRLEAHVASLLAALVDPNLARRPLPVESLDVYLQRRDAERGGVDAEAESSEAPAVEPGGDLQG